MTSATHPLPHLPTAPPTAGERLRVVIVDEELPYPPVSGKRIRTFPLKNQGVTMV